jgi:hypothetical protein
MRTNKRLTVTLVSRLCLLLACAGVAGCEALALTALGVGASAGVTHTAGGVSARTFTAPPQRVKAASLVALEKMGIRLEGIEPHDNGELIKASSAQRDIVIELETMTASTTQMRATAKSGLFTYDAATAREIVEQTEAAMAAPLKPGRRAAAARSQRNAPARGERNAAVRDAGDAAAL